MKLEVKSFLSGAQTSSISELKKSLKK